MSSVSATELIFVIYFPIFLRISKTLEDLAVAAPKIIIMNAARAINTFVRE